ncbi:hypothetical protein LCI18_009482 [Fusarium solani-melongenae]|uniref:Uncharacterized protein n=1 Tax=Fusarium solani subsp. cucurbitae TaxID=2747967 RepID=A0ACD3ZBN0_FUSSC|nr:hypothetical protein LCI18_009482 [Fusarium solani-melongenae]
MMASSQLHGHNRGRDSPDWTAEMRDKQARGKDPSKEEELPEPPEMKDSDQASPDQLKIGGRHAEESHLERERKGEAMSVLDNPEALLAYAQASGDSVTGQRLRWLRQLCGYDEDRDRQQIHPRSSKGQQYVGERGSR